MAVSGAPAGAIAHAEIAVAVTDGRSLPRLDADTGPLFDALRLAPRPVGRLHIGNEFCERLIPSPTLVRRAIGLADAGGLALTLATPTERKLKSLELVRATLDHMEQGADPATLTDFAATSVPAPTAAPRATCATTRRCWTRRNRGAVHSVNFNRPPAPASPWRVAGIGRRSAGSAICPVPWCRWR